MSTSAPAHVQAGHAQKTPKKAALASFLGSTLEYYDFVLYGTASALIFNTLFFPQGDPVVATFASLASFGVAYLSRPLGGIVMSHVGDKLGRKKALMITLIIMGVSSIGIGLLPTYGQIGYWATALLVLCRVAQGFSAGAEAAGASTLTMEHAPEGKRGFFTSFVMTGCSAGTVLATLVFVPVMLLPQEALMSWGWRIPFLLSAVVLLVAYWVRTHLDETPAFEEVEERGAVASAPAITVLRTQWQDVVRIVFVTFFSVMQSLFSVFALSYATGTLGLDRSTMLIVNSVALGISIFTIPLAGALSDRIGRKKVLLIGAAGCIGTAWLYFGALNQGDWTLIFLFAILNQGFFYACWNGVWPVFFPEMFAAPVRYSGMAMGNQFGLLLTGFAPAIAAAILAWGGWVAVVGFLTLCILIACVAIATARETSKVALEELGSRHWRKADADATTLPTPVADAPNAR